MALRVGDPEPENEIEIGDDQDHLRDDPTLPGHYLTPHPDPERRRTPWIRPLGMSPDEAYDYDELGQE